MSFITRKINFKENKTKKAKKALKKALSIGKKHTLSLSKQAFDTTKEFVKTKHHTIKHLLFVAIPLIFLIGISLTAGTTVLKIFGIIKTDKIPCFFCSDIKTGLNNHTNILLAGMGGEEHSGGDLTDTIILASLDHTNKKVGMLSIPRDLWVKTQDGENRINRIYQYGKDNSTPEEGMNFLAKTVSQITGMQVHYFALVDFEGLVDIVDAIDGIDIFVPESIYDPLYPKGETVEYETFSIKKGWRHLDGATALKYARSRETTSDYSRAKRQHDILHAVKEKTISLKMLTSPNKIKNILESINEHFLTNMTLQEMIALAERAPDFEKEGFYSQVYNDVPDYIAGFLYTPERKYFNGAFVLLPNTLDYSETQTFADLFFNHPDMLKDKIKIQIFNGTKHAGLARAAFATMRRYGFNAIEFGNTKNKTLEKSMTYYNNNESNTDKKCREEGCLAATAEALKTWGGFPSPILLPLEYAAKLQVSPKATIVIILGEDFYDFYREHKKWFY